MWRNMSPLRSGAVASDPSTTLAPASRSSGTGQRPRIDAMALGLCTTRVSVSAMIRISSSVKSVLCESSASGPRMFSGSWAYATLPRVCPSWVNRIPCRRLRARAAGACSCNSASVTAVASALSKCSLRKVGDTMQILIRPASVPCQRFTIVSQVASCCSKLTASVSVAPPFQRTKRRGKGGRQGPTARKVRIPTSRTDSQ